MDEKPVSKNVIENNIIFQDPLSYFLPNFYVLCMFMVIIVLEIHQFVVSEKSEYRF